MRKCKNQADIMKKELAVDKAKGGEDIIRCGLIASLFHDIGKTSCKFQNYIKGIDTQSPGHSIVGGYLFDIIVSNSTFDDNIKKDIVKDIIMLHMKDPLYDDKYLYDYYSVDDVKSVVNYIEDVI